MTNAAHPETDGSTQTAGELRPPESWPGAAGRVSRAPSVPGWPGQSTPAAAGESWPGAAPARTSSSRAAPSASSTPTATRQPGATATRRGPVLVAAGLLAALFVVAAVVAWALADDSHRALQGALGGVGASLVIGFVVAAVVWRNSGRR